MAGHSKWANIKHRKAAQDAKRGKIFTKLIREITTSARIGDPDPANNPRLRAAVAAALTGNMTRDTINRAIARGAGGGDGEQLETIVYEGYGPAGSAVMVECLTDNRNRTVAEVRHAFSKCGGNLGTDGSVAYLFTKQGIISYGPEVDGDKLMEAALEAGAEDLQEQDDGSYEIVTTPEEYLDVKESLVKSGLKPDNSEVTMVPATRVDLDQEGAEKILKLIDTLEDLDDVQNVYHNAEISAEIMESL